MSRGFDTANGEPGAAADDQEASSFEAYKKAQARISRRRLWPVTVFYPAYAVIVLVLALRSPHPYIALGFFGVFIPLWTLVEFMFHRFILHGRFGPGKGIIRKFAHERLDPLHWQHHARPFDGLHINGGVTDLLGLFIVAALVSFLAPVYTLPVLLAGMVQFYVVEEWVHHSTHFYNLGGAYFRYIKRHHGFHHTAAGTELGYGLTNGFWDMVFNTHYPEEVRRVLYGTRWSLSPWRARQKPLYDLDRIIGPILITATKARELSPEQAVDLLLKRPEVAKAAASFGAVHQVVLKALERLRKYGLTAEIHGHLTISEPNHLRAYIAA
ncbi:MAG: sterol desaturase family protein [Acidobacteria bacterium]|nr:sterol desaturase family protein [Acidobacteriota bacterium]